MRSLGMRSLVVVFAVSGCADHVDQVLLESTSPPPTTPPTVSATISIEGTALDERDPIVPALPFIFVHGFAGFTDVGDVDYFFEVESHLESLGVDVTAPAMPPVNGSDQRARVLADAIDATLERTGAEKLHLVGHSQGGLDIRQVLPTHADKIASATTISTPHAGTRIAELAQLAPDGTLNPAGRFLAWLIGVGEGEPPTQDEWNNDETSDAWTPELEAAFASLTPAGAALLPPIPEEVPFFSYAGVSNGREVGDVDACDGTGAGEDAIDPALAVSGTILLIDGANDGLVTVDSAHAGTFVGCVPADHADEIGHFQDAPPIASGFDHFAFYEGIVAQARASE